MKLYSYIITNETGFAPNPFWGHCTLACCKPKIRKSAVEGDWVVGIRGKTLYKKMGFTADGDESAIFRIIYAMKVAKRLPFAEYYIKYPDKIPIVKRSERIYHRGDNIYEPTGNGEIKQVKTSFHNDEENQKKDLDGKYVLIADQFYYFGSQPIEIRDNLKKLICGRGHKCKFDSGFQIDFLDYITKRRQGVHARPSLWDEDDASWKQAQR